MKIRRHLFARHLGMTLGVLAAVFVLLTLGQFADTVRYMGGEGGVPAIQLLWRAMLRAPALLQQALPLVIVLSTILVLHRMGEHRELITLTGVGLSAAQILLPLILSGAVVGAGFVYLVSPLAGAALAQAEAFERDVLGLRASVRARHIAVQSDQGMIYVFASAVTDEGDRLQEVTFFELNENHQLIRRVDFRHAERDSAGQWTFEDYREALGSEPAVAVPPPADLPFAVDLLSGRLADRLSIAVYDLPAAALYAASVAAQPLPYLFQFHWLVALPALLGMIALAAGAIGYHLLPGQPMVRRAFDMVLLGLPFYALTIVIEALAIRGLVPVIMAAWAVPAILLLTGIGVARLRHL